LPDNQYEMIVRVGNNATRVKGRAAFSWLLELGNAWFFRSAK